MSVAISKGVSEIALTQLCTTLDAMIPVQQQLLTLLQDEKRLIVEGETEGLIQCSHKKEMALQRIAELEKQRIETIQSMSNVEDPLTLKKLISICPQAYRVRLQSAQHRLDALMASIQEINQMNGLLVGRVLTQISGLLGVLNHLTSGGPTYQKTGKINAASSGGRTIGRG